MTHTDPNVSRYYQSAIRYSLASNCCNRYICTRCGEIGAGAICCDEKDPVSTFPRNTLGPHPIRQHYPVTEYGPGLD